MSAGTFLADNWLVDADLTDALTDDPDTGVVADLVDYESGIQAEWDLTATATPGQMDLIVDTSGNSWKPNSIAIINHNMTHASASFATVLVESGTSAAMANAFTLADVDLDNTDEWETPYNFYSALGGGGTARRYFRIRITDPTLQAAGVNLKIGQIILSSDALVADNDRTSHSAAGLSQNFAYGWSRSIGPIGSQSTTVGGDTHQLTISQLTSINGLQFNATSETDARKIVNLITGRHGRDRMYQHLQNENLFNAAGLPIVFIPDVGDIKCWYCFSQFTGLRIIEPSVSGCFDVGPFLLREQGL